MSLNGNSDETNGYNTVIKRGALADPNMVKAVIPPIGAVMAWFKSIVGVPSLPDGWIECTWGTSPLDGSGILSDTSSPLDGKVIPNLNGGANKMLRGATTSGGTGGSDTHTHAHTLTGDAPASAGFNAGAGATSCAVYSHSHAIGGSITSATDIPAYTETVWIMRVK